MADDRDRARILAPPPVLFFACLGIGWGLSTLWPVGIRGFAGVPQLVVAAALLVAALALAVPSLAAMRRHRTPVDPSKPTARIVTDGPYRLTRNPRYVALLLLFGAFAAVVATVWMVALAVCLFVLLDVGVVRREEAYLATKFGSVYDEYRSRVRRWI